MKRAVVAALVFAIAMVGAGTVQVRVIREGSGRAQLLWHDDEAFLFLATGRGGWNVSCLWWLFSQLSPYGPGTTDSRIGMMVYRMTSETIEKRRFEGAAPPDLIAFDGAVSAGGAPWTGDRFDTSRPKPVPRGFGDRTPQEFSSVDGWSKRLFLLAPNRSGGVDFRLGGRAARLLLSSNNDVETIDLERAGRPVERLWTADRRLRWVGAEEYETFLKEPPPN